MAVVDDEISNHLKAIFLPLNQEAAAKLPTSAALSEALARIVDSRSQRDGSSSVNVDPRIAKLFASAAVDIWLRGIHSLLISASLTRASPIWAAVSGYYSSYYCVRGLAHLLGYFHLFRRKRLVRLETNGSYVCSFENRTQTSDQEHKLYWRIVGADRHFSSDAFFAPTVENRGFEAGHRNHANYADHLYPYPTFATLDEASIRRRIARIAEIETDTPPVPNKENFPDIESVQVLAYHRIVLFRHFLDEALGSSSRFWMVHRNPAWTRDVIDFQATSLGGVRPMPITP